MQIIASWGGEDVAVEVGDECRSLAALKHALRSALPVDPEKVCLEVGGRAMEEEDVIGLVEGIKIEVALSPAAHAVDTLREEGHVVSLRALCTAADEGDMRRCELYLDAGIDVSAEGLDSPLHWAVRAQHVDVCTLLLERGSDPNSRCFASASTLLHVAVRGKAEVCALLIDHGADVNARAYCEYTPLHLAVDKQNAGVCTLLLDRGCDVDARDFKQRTPLYLAVAKENTRLCSLLLDHGSDVNTRSDVSEVTTPLHLAVKKENADLCTLLLDRGADVNAKTAARRTPLHVASVAKSTKLFTLLLDRGADVTAKDRCGKRPARPV